MRNRSRSMLGLALAVVVVGGLFVGGAGNAAASPTVPTSVPSPTPTAPCSPILPLFVTPSSATYTIVTISYSLTLRPLCDHDLPITFTLFASRDDAQKWLKPVAELVSERTPAGQVTFTGLKSGTEYWLRASAGGQVDPDLLELVQTRPGGGCATVVPFHLDVSAVTSTSATISYTLDYSPPCGYDPPVTFTAFASRLDSRDRHWPVAQAVSGPTRDGKVTVTGLKADTEYWIRPNFGPLPGELDIAVRTAPAPGCTATVLIDHQWDGGFIATVAVRNDAADALDGWRVAWRWSGDEQIQALWNAASEVSGADVTVRNASHNARLAPGATTTFGMVVAAGTQPDGIVANCQPQGLPMA